MAEGDPNNNQRGRRSGPCRLWGGLDKARHIIPTDLLVRVQCFRKSLYKAVQGPSTRPIVLSMINGSYCRRRRRLTIFEPDEMKFGVSLTLLSTPAHASPTAWLEPRVKHTNQLCHGGLPKHDCVTEVSKWRLLPNCSNRNPEMDYGPICMTKDLISKIRGPKCKCITSV